MPAAARRYESTEGLWTVPFVDAEKMILVRRALTGTGGVWLWVGSSFEFIGLAARALLADSPPPGDLVGFILGVTAIIVTAFLATLEATRANRHSRLVVPRTPVVVRRVNAGGAAVERSARPEFEATVAGRVIGPTSKRGLVHAQLGRSERLLLILSDEVIELYRALYYPGGGQRVVAHHWTVQDLEGGEGSPPVGAAVFGDGRTEPLARNLRAILHLNAEDTRHVEGPKGTGFDVLVTLAIALLPPAVAGVLVWRLPMRVETIEPEPLRVAFAVVVAAAFAAVHFLLLEAYFRRMARRFIDPVVEGLVTNPMFWTR